jgi:capsular exopolysaccharide synthesis family protein
VEPIDYLRALRQWWHVIVALTLVGFIAAFVTAGGDATEYQATHVLIEDSGEGGISLARASFLATSGEVPEAVAEQLGGDPRALGSTVRATTDLELNGIRITATADTPDRAVVVADAFADQLVQSLDGQVEATRQEDIAAVNARIFDLTGQLLRAPPPATRDALQGQLEEALNEREDLERSRATAGYSTIQEASAFAVGGSTSRTTRLAVGGLMGLLAGVIAALLLTRFDTRVRTKEAAEQAFGYPVLAEIPMLRRNLRGKYAMVTEADPESLAAESYRGLRTAMLATGQSRALEPDRGRSRRRPRPVTTSDRSTGRVMLVASPGMGEGKTTTAANLAVAFAEAGRSVLVVGCDLRRPEIHLYFGLESSPGLSDVLQESEETRSFATVIHDTQIPGVQVVTSGSPIEHPGELLNRGLALLRSARTYADVVILDTAPLLATDDASVLVPLVDDVVLLCRSGRTSVEAAQRARQLLDRLNAPVIGVVLNGAMQLPSARSYYRMDYRSRGRGRAVPTKPIVADPEPQTNGDRSTGDDTPARGVRSTTEAIDDSAVDEATGQKKTDGGDPSNVSDFKAVWVARGER